MICDVCKKQRRTGQQNKALHLYFTQLAEALNEAGYDLRATIRQEIDIPWSALTIKEYLWRPVQQQYLLEQSTTKITTKDIDKIYDIVNKAIGERTGVHIPWPSINELISKESEV